MKRLLSVLIFSFTAAVILLLGSPTAAVFASAPKQGVSAQAKQASVLRIAEIGKKPMGSDFLVTALVTSASGEPIPGASIAFSMDNQYQGRVRSDANGVATYRMGARFDSGTYNITASFNGNYWFEPTITTSQIELTPSTFVVQTVAPLAGVKFKLGDKVFVTDSSGVGKVPVEKIGNYQLEILTENDLPANEKFEFIRWVDNVFEPRREVSLPTDKPLQAGIKIYYRVGQTFVDLDGKPVANSRIQEITLKNSAGATYTFNDGQLRWLPVSQVARRSTGFDPVPIKYSIMSVKVDGSNVVNSGQQRFFAKPDEVWPVSLLLYSIKIAGRDAFFNTPVGKGVNVQFPNGSKQYFAYNQPNAELELSVLARGIYRVQIAGAPKAYSPYSPVAITKNQDVALSVITPLDMVLAGGSLFMLALGLLLIGRFQLVERVQRK